MARESGPTRRSVLRSATMLAPALLMGADTTPSRAPQAQKQAAGEQEVSTVEDLMREHGVLRRVLFIYGEAIRLIAQKGDLPPAVVAGAAGLVRRFVEDYHEKLEEDYLFPRLQKAATEVDLVKVLADQHQKGRTLTGEILTFSTAAALKNARDRDRLQGRMELFVRMYGPHAAREDTVLFPAFKKVVSPAEYDALGDEFEKKEQQMFGQDGFEKSVDEVAALEKQIGIYDLAHVTPRV
jgi:hemerythrin-like domain-containing protein